MTWPCFICQRGSEPRGLTYKNKPVCGGCAPFAPQGEMMLEFTETETESLAEGGSQGGAYLDSIGKTDLATLSQEQWMTFLEEVFDGYNKNMVMEAAKYPPF